MPYVGVTGATGFIGNALVQALRARGDRVRALVRDPQNAKLGDAVEAQRVDLMRAVDPMAVSGLDAVIHLAGETVGGRWTAEKKNAIESTRVLGTRNLVAALRAAKQPPRVLVSASASGYYGDRGDEPLLESSPPGDDFLARVCVGWESEAAATRAYGLRVVSVRLGLVFAAGGGALQPMLAPFRWGAGGPLGSGRQWWPWIHRDDAVALFLHVLDREDLDGAVNGVAPDVANNARFARELGRALGRPAVAPAPGFALKTVLGEFAESILASQLMLAAKAEDSGFEWRHPSLEEALLSIFESGRSPAREHFEQEQVVGADLPRVAAFFQDAANLGRLTPPRYRWQELRPPGDVRTGTVLEHSFRMHGLPVRWQSLITRWHKDRGFTDVQLRGPFAWWRHRHAFASRGDGTLVSDTVDYALPFAPLSGVALPLVRRDLEESFRYRKRRIAELLSGDSC